MTSHGIDAIRDELGDTILVVDTEGINLSSQRCYAFAALWAGLESYRLGTLGHSRHGFVISQRWKEVAHELLSSFDSSLLDPFASWIFSRLLD